MGVKAARAREVVSRQEPDLTCVIDLDGALRTVDSATERALGFAGSDLVGRTLASLVLAADQRAVSEALAQVRNGACVDGLELRVLRRHGAPLRCSWSVHPVAGRQMALAFATDLSEPHDEAASPAQAQLVAVLDALDVPICISDLEDGTVLLANGPFRARFGEDCGNLSAVERGFAVAPSERFSRSTLVDERGEPSGVHVGEFHHLADQRSYLVRAIAIRWAPRRLARLHAFVDITHRVESERFQRAQQEKLLLTSRWMSVGELASTLAHELNQPLGAITNYVRGAIRRLSAAGEPNTQGVVGALEHALLQAEHAAKVVSRIREFVRTREPRREAVPVGELVNGVVQLIEAEAHKHHVKLRLSLPAELPRAFADRVMIEQVILNLVKNAIEAMDGTPPGSREVSISGVVNAEGMVEVAVEDTGSGFSAETREQIFSPFFTTKQDGMGIGLSICRSIVEYHDGGLFFTSTASGGARFWFTLPQAR
jgi:PAS domain S-box-containing protein